ncbi:hypothetical protein ACQBAR_15875 [Propionibacteriaceae bacterium Y1685]
MTAQLMETLSKVEELARQTPATMTRQSLPAVETETSVLDDHIRVRMSGGSVTDVRLHPAAMRLPAADLGRHLTKVFNLAQRQHSEAMAAELAAEQTDFGQMANQVSTLRDEANRAMSACLAGFTESLLHGNK